MLEINYVSDITFKYIHDLIEDYEPSEIVFHELEDDTVDINNLFVIANLIQYFKPGIKLTYHTYRTELPTEELHPETFFSGVPFDKVKLKNTFICLT